MAKIKPDTALTTGARQSSALTVERPSFAISQQGESTGLELVTQFVRPPIVKVVQKSASDDLLAKFDVGDVIVTPSQELVAKFGEPFHVVPIFFYPEWLLVNPIELKGRLPFIRERSLDPRSELALRSASPDTRFEQCPEDKELTIRYVEVLSFVCALVGDHPLAGDLLLIPFSKAEHKHGALFAGLIRSRKAKICAGVYELRGSDAGRKNDSGSWRGLDVSNPTVDGVSAWVTDEAKFNAYWQVHLEMKAAHDAKTLRPDFDENTVEAGTGGGDPAAEKRF